MSNQSTFVYNTANPKAKVQSLPEHIEMPNTEANDPCQMDPSYEDYLITKLRNSLSGFFDRVCKETFMYRSSVKVTGNIDFLIDDYTTLRVSVEETIQAISEAPTTSQQDDKQGHERPKRHKAAVKYMDSASDFEVEQLLNNDANDKAWSTEKDASSYTVDTNYLETQLDQVTDNVNNASLKAQAAEVKDFQCELCKKSFSTLTHLKTHVKKVHNKTGRLTFYQCKECSKYCHNEAKLEEHQNQKHDHRCEKCHLVFTNANESRKHMEEAHKTDSLSCTLCGRVCSSKVALRKHIQRHRQGNSFPCLLCGKVFTAASTLYHHKRGVHSKEQPYQCQLCPKRFNFHHSLKLHILKHEGRRPHQCTLCKKTYLTNAHLKSHVIAIHGNHSYQCQVCKKTFPYENSLKAHVTIHSSDRPYLCNVCGKSYATVTSLKVHESYHSNTTHECDVCQKVFKSLTLLKTHKRKHSPSAAMFVCDVCGIQFVYRGQLQSHYAVHKEERNFACSLCDKAFKTAATLHSHGLVHKVDSPFSCQTCGKSFKSKERLTAHQKRHSGEKPFQCDLCGHCFPDKGGLTKHRTTVHSAAKLFGCPVCQKTCTRADNLRTHMKVHKDPALLKLSYHELLVKENVDDTPSGNAIPGGLPSGSAAPGGVPIGSTAPSGMVSSSMALSGMVSGSTILTSGVVSDGTILTSGVVPSGSMGPSGIIANGTILASGVPSTMAPSDVVASGVASDNAVNTPSCSVVSNFVPSSGNIDYYVQADHAAPLTRVTHLGALQCKSADPSDARAGTEVLKPLQSQLVLGNNPDGSLALVLQVDPLMAQQGLL